MKWRLRERKMKPTCEEEAEWKRKLRELATYVNGKEATFVRTCRELFGRPAKKK